MGQKHIQRDGKNKEYNKYMIDWIMVRNDENGKEIAKEVDYVEEFADEDIEGYEIYKKTNPN